MKQKLYLNAHFHTLDPAKPQAEALLVEGEQISAVGSVQELRALARPGVREIDLENLTVIPGLTDAHIHSAGFARDMTTVDLRAARSLEEALAAVSLHAAGLPEDAWVFGGRWDSNTWSVPVQPTRHDLDTICPDRPVALPSIDGHTVWANSLALAAVGIGRHTTDPVGGQIVRDAHGEPTGILRESASYPLRDLMNSPLSGRLDDQLVAAQRHLLSLGLTTIHDIDGEDCREAYLQLKEAGRLQLRVHKSIPMVALEQAIAEGRKTGQGDRWFSTGPVKVFTDGALGSHSCHMSQPFPGEGQNYGIEVTPYKRLEELVTRADRAGIAVACHAIGDQANHLVLDAYQQLPRDGSSSGLRHRIEHTQHLQRADVARLAALNVVASMQPTHCTSDIPLADSLLGDRQLASYAWHSLLDAGAVVAFGSDAPVEDPNPFHGIHAALTRQDSQGLPPEGWQAAERLDLDQVLHAYIAAPAYAAGEEQWKGRLSPGMLADFIALDTDIFSAAPEQIRTTAVRTTVVGGETRYQG